MTGQVIHRVLVVEDEAEYRQLIQTYLQAQGYRSETASSADEALKWLRAEDFDLVIADIRMDGKDGLQLMQEAQTMRPDLLFLIMTGHYQEYSYAAIIASGAADFVAKPFDMDGLNARVQRIEREHRTLRQLKEANAALSRKARINAGIAELTRALASHLSFESISELVLDCAQALTDSELGYVGYVDPTSGFLICPTFTGSVWEQCGVTDKVFVFREFGGLWGSVLNNRQPLLSNDVPADSRSTGVPKGHLPIQRFLSTPAVLHGELIGQIAVANAEREYTEKDLAVMDVLANIYAVAVQRQREDDAVRRTRDLLESVLECSAEAIGVFGPGGRLIEWNRAATELFGYTRSDLETLSVYDIYADKDALRGMLSRLRQDGLIRRQQMRMLRKDGGELICELSINLLRDKDGQIIGSVTVALDLSDLKQSLADQRAANERLEEEVVERKRIEEELRALQAKLESVLEERTAKLSRAGALIKRSMKTMQQVTEE